MKILYASEDEKVHIDEGGKLSILPLEGAAAAGGDDEDMLNDEEEKENW